LKIKKLLPIILIISLIFASISAVAAPLTYTVVKGDTLWDIGIEYGVGWWEIQELNGIEDVRALQIGTVLEIPGTEVETEDSEIDDPTVEDSETEEVAEEYTEYPILITNGDYEIPGIVCLPVGEGPFPAVIMLHGTGSEKNEAGGGYELTAPELAKSGIASIRIDFIGNGDSTEDYINYNYTTAVSDANAAREYMASLDTVDGNRIGIMGWSQGGTIAMLAAGHNRSFQSVVTWAGAPDLTSVGNEENYETAKEDGYYNLTFEWREPLKLGLQWFNEVYSTDVLEVFSYSDAPVLAINGANDTTVDPENANKIVEASSNEKSKTLFIENADHTFNIFTGDMTAFNELISATVEWFDETLEPVYSEDIVYIENDGRIVPATVVVPAGEGPHPSVVINHGHGGSREENGGFAGVAEALANKGILSIRMDFPGCGESTEPFTENYLSNMISDSNASLDYILENYNVDEENLGIFGYSMGGRIALEIVREDDNPYEAMALLAPSAEDGSEMIVSFLGGEEAYNDYYEEASSEKGYADFTTIYGQEQQLSINWFEEMKESKPLDNIENFQGNILVLYGDMDTTVPMEESESVVSAHPNDEGVMIPNANHGYGFYSDQPDVTETVEDQTAEFFFENFNNDTE
jgi:dienelactone hydrolase